MSRSGDPDHFFQTSHSIAEISRKQLKSKNNHGCPIRLQSKILAMIVDQKASNAVYIAESAGTARRVALADSGKTTHIFRGPTTPLTCLVTSFGPQDSILFAGSWDKSIWSWSTVTRTPARRFFGHTDFVNALLYLRLNGNEVLISGSADARIIVWNAVTGEKLYILRGHVRGVLDLAIDPTTYLDPINQVDPIVLFSAGSDREIRRWRIDQSARSIEQIEAENLILQHETSVYCLNFDADDDLWTASADGSAKCLSRAQHWQADTTLIHGDYVRSVAIDESGGWVVTAGRDEHVKVWDKATGKLHHVYEGHYEEVTGLVVREKSVVSVSIDATIRQWSLQSEDLSEAKREAAEADKGLKKEDAPKAKSGGLTEEEERELDDLLGDSE